MSLLDSLFVFYDCDSDGNADDASGLDLTNNNTVTFNGTKASFNGSNWLSHSSNSAFQITGDKTFAAWVTPSDVGNSLLFAGKGDASFSGGEWYMGYLTGSGFTIAGFKSPATQVNCTDPNTRSNGTLYFVCAQYDSSNQLLKISVNNGSVTTAALAGVNTTSDTFAIGRCGSFGSLMWSGGVQSFGMWNRLLSSGEITSLYNGGTPLKYADIPVGATGNMLLMF
jgi:hypothetical protein